MPDLLIELRSEEIPARPLARSGAAVRTGKGNSGMRCIMVELN
ncbi:glycyl-tRNA synthetase beta chain [Hoeflea sp. IMCC20628]|nr:glycyl-tRNA synthetase beta chain [Hoeflea sp. IMCC20628]